MRILFGVMYLAGASAVTDVGASAVTDVGAHVEPSESARPLPIVQCEGQTTRHLRALESTLNNDEERVFPETADLLASGVNKRLREGSESQIDHKRLKMYIEDDTPVDELPKMLEFHETETRKQIQNEMDKKKHQAPSIQPASPKTFDAQKQDKEMAELKVIAKKNQDKIIRLKWMRANIDPGSLLKAMTRAKPEVNIFKNSKMPNWVLYVDDFNKMYPDKAKTLIGWLEDGCKEFVAKLYQKRAIPRKDPLVNQVLDELIESWLNAKYEPADVYVRLGLPSEGNLDFSSARFSEWKHYVAAFNYVYPELKKSYCSILVFVFKTDGLLALLKDAPKSSRTKRVAMDFKHYLKHEAPTVNTLSEEEVKLLLKSVKEVIGSIHAVAEQNRPPRALQYPRTLEMNFVND